jgi:hypothetical protein
VAGLPDTVAVGEQAEQPLDPRSSAAQVLGGSGSSSASRAEVGPPLALAVGLGIRATLPAGQVTVPATRLISNSALWKPETLREVAGGASTPTSRLRELLERVAVAEGGVAEQALRAASAGWASIRRLACGPSCSQAGATSTAVISGSGVLVAAAESL